MMSRRTSSWTRAAASDPPETSVVSVWPRTAFDTCLSSQLASFS
jgi:hypothetical protein